ncbi:MAG TPA: isocitrate lyase/PEP mutase family protein [Acetobacteraceae bacterium]|nr:isocitrate lyase/PEP mutase family protein [Acetobacteraceae bacterium]
MADRLRTLLAGDKPVWAPLVLNPMMARLAAAAGFPALYLGGGSMGYQTCFTEANLTLTEMVEAGVNIRAACDLPLILDAAGGWGDPMHLRRTIPLAEAAGFAAIEIEDQLLPKRAHHHIGREHNIPLELMVAKVAEAVAARRSPEFLVIARTNAVRNEGMDEALRRAEAMHKAGADMLFVLARTPEEWRHLGERLPAPLLYMVGSAGVASMKATPEELFALGYRLFVDPVMPLLAMHRALRGSYAALAALRPDPLVGAEGGAEQNLMHETIGLATLLEIERRTTER